MIPRLGQDTPTSSPLKSFEAVWHWSPISLAAPDAALPPPEKAKDNFNSLFETNNSRDRRLVVTTASHYNTRVGMAHGRDRPGASEQYIQFKQWLNW